MLNVILRIRSILMISVFALVIASPVMLNMLKETHLIPDEFLDMNKEYSYLECKVFANIPTFSGDSFFAGEYQDGLERALRDRVPMREEMILTNARFQRFFIRESAGLFCFEVYPTFYASDVQYVEKDDVLLRLPKKASDPAFQSKLSNALERFNDFRERFDDKRMYVYGCMSSQHLDDSPLSALVSSPYTYSYFKDGFVGGLNGFGYIDGNLPYRDYLEQWYKSDHHWKIEGAYNGYEDIASALGFGDDLICPGDLKEWTTVPLLGSNARVGLFDSGAIDYLVDYDFDLPEIKAKVADEQEGLEAIVNDAWHEDAVGRGLKDPVYIDFYPMHFHGNYPELSLRNDSFDDDRALLLVGDSFTSSIERLFTHHYRTVYAFDPRVTNKTIAEYMEEHPDIEDIVFAFNLDGMIDDSMREALL